MFEGLLQLMHLLVILGIALLVFGPKKVPELGKGIGVAAGVADEVERRGEGRHVCLTKMLGVQIKKSRPDKPSG